jgi:4-hydroxybenzoate polyprenyltransferase
MVVCLLALVHSFHLHVLSLAGVGAVGALLIYEHGLVKPHDLSRVNAAFFTINGYVSVLFFAFWAADIFLYRKGLI